MESTVERIRKYAETAVVLTAIAGACIWMSTSINSLEKEMNSKLSHLDKEVTVIKTILYMQGLIPDHYASHKEMKHEKPT